MQVCRVRLAGEAGRRVAWQGGGAPVQQVPCTPQPRSHTGCIPTPPTPPSRLLTIRLQQDDGGAGRPLHLPHQPRVHSVRIQRGPQPAAMHGWGSARQGVRTSRVDWAGLRDPAGSLRHLLCMPQRIQPQQQQQQRLTCAPARPGPAAPRGGWGSPGARPPQPGCRPAAGRQQAAAAGHEAGQVCARLLN